MSSVYIFMYVCMYACMYICIYVCILQQKQAAKLRVIMLNEKQTHFKKHDIIL